MFFRLVRLCLFLRIYNHFDNLLPKVVLVPITSRVGTGSRRPKAVGLQGMSSPLRYGSLGTKVGTAIIILSPSSPTFPRRSPRPVAAPAALTIEAMISTTMIGLVGVTITT
jgi:hypothetical protein